MHVLTVGCIVASVCRLFPHHSLWAVRVFILMTPAFWDIRKMVKAVHGVGTAYLSLQIISALIWRHHPAHQFNLYGVDFPLYSSPVLSPLPRTLGSCEQRGCPGLPCRRRAAAHEHVQAVHGGEFLWGCRGVQDLLTVTSEIPGEAG